MDLSHAGAVGKSHFVVRLVNRGQPHISRDRSRDMPWSCKPSATIYVKSKRNMLSRTMRKVTRLRDLAGSISVESTSRYHARTLICYSTACLVAAGSD